MSTGAHHYHYYHNGGFYYHNANLRRRAAFTAIMAHRRGRTITAVNIHATATAIADEDSSTPPVPSKEETPPKSAEFLLYLLLSHEDREALPGDLEEEYRTAILPKFGARRAVLWYWCQVVRSIWPVISGTVSKLVWWLIKRFTT